MITPPRVGSISIFFPAFNDEATISALVINAFELLETRTDDYEVIVVDDGSVDGTREALDKLSPKYPHLRIVRHDRNRGYGAALRSGFQHTNKDFVFYTDGDGQYDVRELDVLLSLMTDGVDVVNGYKMRRQDNRRRRALGGMYNGLAHLLFRIPISDVDCDFRLLRRSAIGRISLDASSGAICVELVHKLSSAGCVFKEVPVNHYPRVHGESQFFTPRRVARTLLEFFILWWGLVATRRLAFSTPYPAERF